MGSLAVRTAVVRNTLSGGLGHGEAITCSAEAVSLAASGEFESIKMPLEGGE